MKKLNTFPRGWNEKKVRRVITHYESQTPEEEVAEDEAAFRDPSQVVVSIPKKLLPDVRRLIAKSLSR